MLINEGLQAVVNNAANANREETNIYAQELRREGHVL